MITYVEKKLTILLTPTKRFGHQRNEIQGTILVKNSQSYEVRP
jgi:hypothetical protein